MPEISGLLYGRQDTDPDTITGTTFTEIPLDDRDGTSTTIVPADGVEYLVFVFGMCHNVSSNTSWAEIRALFGSTVYGRGRSTSRFGTFAADDTFGGKPLATVFTVTGNGSDEITVEGAAQSAGQDCAHFGVEVLCVPTSALADFQSQEGANSETAASTPTSGYEVIGTDLVFDPSSDGDYIIISTFEGFGDGTEVGGTDEYDVEFRFGEDGSEANVQQATIADVAAGQGGGNSIESYRYVSLQESLSSGTDYSVQFRMNGTSSGGNLGARRIRHYAFRASSVAFVTNAITTAGVSSNPGAAGTDEPTGSQISIEDPGSSDILHTYFANMDSQINNFMTLHFQRDIGTGGGSTTGANMFRAISNNGLTTADDIVHIPMQRSEELTSGSSYTIDVQGTWHTAAVNTISRNRGDTADADNEVVGIRWEPGGTSGSFDGNLPVPTLDAAASAFHTGAFAGDLLLPELDAVGEAPLNNPSGNFNGSLPLPELAAVSFAHPQGQFGGELPLPQLDAVGLDPPQGVLTGVLPLPQLASVADAPPDPGSGSGGSGSNLWTPTVPAIIVASPEVFQAKPWDVVAGLGDILSALSDTFPGATLGAQWTIEDDNAAIDQNTVAGGEYNLGILAGGLGGSHWFDARVGVLVYVEIIGPFMMRARVRVRNDADSGAPPTGGGARLAGIAAHDPRRDALNYVHLVAGSEAINCIEWKSTDAIAGGSTDTSAFNAATAAPNSTVAVDLQLVRRVSNQQIFDMSFRDAEGGHSLENEDEAFTSLISINRTDNTAPGRAANGAVADLAVPLPARLRVGMIVYATPVGDDVQAFFEGIMVRRDHPSII